MTIISLYIVYIYTKNLLLNAKFSTFNLLAKIFQFIKILVIEQIQTYALIPVIFFLFIAIISSNIIGMIPYTTTTTSNIIITLGLALIVFMAINILYIINKKLQSVDIFLPTGTPLFITPFLIQIEIVSYLSRVISLSVRLFANMTSGHTLIKILSGFCTSLLKTGGLGIVVSSTIVLVIFAVTGLELVIAVLQTYVFVILLCIYLHELETGH